MREQFETLRSTQLPRMEWIVPDFHDDGVNLKNGLLYFAKRNGTKQNGTKRNGTKRNGTKRNGKSVLCEMGNLYFAEQAGI